MNLIVKKNKIINDIATVMLYLIAGLILSLLAAFTIYILVKGAGSLSGANLGFGENGIGTQLFNTVYLVFLSLLISVPFGIIAGIYMAEYANEGRLTDIIRTCIETLSSLPSIVVGLFGYLVLIVMTHSTWNLLAGSVAVSILSIPLITRVTEDAIRAIPKEYKEGSYGIGATQWQTIVHILLPTATPRIMTGIILAAGRGFGEAAALLYTSGMSSSVDFSKWNPFDMKSPLNPFRPADTLAVHIWALKTEGIAANADQIANLAAAVLLLLVLSFSLGSRFLYKILERKTFGK
jgi:phosphate transport system permease protein